MMCDSIFVLEGLLLFCVCFYIVYKALILHTRPCRLARGRRAVPAHTLCHSSSSVTLPPGLFFVDCQQEGFTHVLSCVRALCQYALCVLGSSLSLQSPDSSPASAQSSWQKHATLVSTLGQRGILPKHTLTVCSASARISSPAGCSLPLP